MTGGPTKKALAYAIIDEFGGDFQRLMVQLGPLPSRTPNFVENEVNMALYLARSRNKSELETILDSIIEIKKAGRW